MYQTLGKRDLPVSVGLSSSSSSSLSCTPSSVASHSISLQQECTHVCMEKDNTCDNSWLARDLFASRLVHMSVQGPHCCEIKRVHLKTTRERFFSTFSPTESITTSKGPHILDDITQKTLATCRPLLASIIFCLASLCSVHLLCCLWAFLLAWTILACDTICLVCRTNTKWTVSHGLIQ